MSFHVFFSMSTGLNEPIRCPKGTYKRCLERVAHVEKMLGLKRTKYRDNPIHWDHLANLKEMAKVPNDVLCREAEKHNTWVRWLYGQFEEWSKTPPQGDDTELLTPEMAAEFWHALEFIEVPLDRWTSDYYRARMEACYEVMRRGESDGVSFDAKPLTAKQADAVIRLFSQFLDAHDIRLAVPVGRDCLKSSDDGGYTWCEKCGAIDEDDVEYKIKYCRKRGGCPLRECYGKGDDD